MIIGIGTDILQINRIKKVLEKTAHFPKRILTTTEQADYERSSDPINFLAKRFSIKESCSKALGCGIGQDLSFTDIEITHDKKRAPLLKIKKYPQYKVHVSVSDEKDYIVSFVIIEKPL